MSQIDNRFLGLAPFLRMNIHGDDLMAFSRNLLAKAQNFPEDSNLWMNLSTAMFCLGQRDLGLAMQAQALEINRIYRLAASTQIAKLRLLLLMAPGDLAANTPLDCLLENTDIDLIFYYVSADELFAHPLPDHDLLMVALSEHEDHSKLLAMLDRRLKNWLQPIINAPQYISTTRRNVASTLLQDVPGLCIPSTLRVSRATLESISKELTPLSELIENCDFPVILRPVDSHAGRDLVKIENSMEITAYLAQVDVTAFFLSKFIDYSGQDGQFRKFRIALVDGHPFACHMAVSSHWMIHYVNAGMYEDADKRAEERFFMENFPDFAERHQTALNEIYQRTKLDYLCIDCAETRAGELLIFEIDHAMVVHAMDSEELFPHKQFHMQKVKSAFRDFLIRLNSGKTSCIPSKPASC